MFYNKISYNITVFLIIYSVRYYLKKFLLWLTCMLVFMNNKKILGLRIRELRLRKRLKQEELAELVGVEPTSICNIETGRNYPSFNNLEKIAEALGVSFTEIFDFEHKDTQENLLQEINKMLKQNPDRIPDVYKMLKGLFK